MSTHSAACDINYQIIKIDRNKPALAAALYQVKNKFIWPETEFKSWRGFCNTKIELSYSTIYRYIKTAELFNKLNYSVIEVNYLVSSIGWSRFQLGLTYLDENITVADFIDRFRDLNLNERVVFGESESNLVQFSFALPEHTAEKLTDELLLRGMRLNNKTRCNASNAMVKLIRDIGKK